MKISESNNWGICHEHMCQHTSRSDENKDKLVITTMIMWYELIIAMMITLYDNAIVIMAIASPLIMTYVMYRIHCKQKKQQAEIHCEQKKQQTKIDSAKISMDLLIPWRKNDTFTNFLEDISNSTIRPGNENMIRETLGQFENIAVLWKDGVLTENHVKEFFGANLKDIQANTVMMTYFYKIRNKNPNYFYVNLAELFKKYQSWDI